MKEISFSEISFFFRDGIEEWAMIELQGTLDSVGTLAGQHIGNLKWENKKVMNFFQINELENYVWESSSKNSRLYWIPYIILSDFVCIVHF